MTATTPIRIAFTHISRPLWAGGYNYQANLFAALARFRPGEFAPIVFAGPQADQAELVELAAIPGVQVARSAAFGRPGLTEALAIGLDRGAAEVFKSEQIDIVVESARFFGWRLGIPAIAWIPDLQHRSLPHLFTRMGRMRREAGFRVQIASGRTIMLSSESALRDFRIYYPARSRVHVVHFATQPQAALLTAHADDVIATYGLPESYFYLPNQFYRHKNHQLVVDALTITKQRGANVVVCASGSTDDPREPGHYELVMAEVRKRGLESQFRHVGLIPLPHVFALLRASTAMINPSRFEGWSTTVEEAKSFGVPMILSGIDVHREQTVGAARYFDVDDPVKLADHLMDASRQSHDRVVREIVADQDKRVSAFAANFVKTIKQTL